MARGGLLRSALFRGVGFAALWVVLIGAGHMPTGLATAAAATWVSLRLLPPGSERLRLLALPGILLRFAWNSALAGWDVALRALGPRLRLHPGFVAYRVHLPPGVARSAFTTLTSLMPGTLPAGDDGEALLYHCLDVDQPVAVQLAAEEAALSRAFAGSRRDA